MEDRGAPTSTRWPLKAAALVGVAGVVAGGLLFVAAGQPALSDAAGLRPDLVFAVAYAVVGWLLLRRAPENRLGVVLCVLPFLEGAARLCGGYAFYSAIRHGGSFAGTINAYKASGVFYVAAFVVLTVVVPLRFPTGTLVTRWLRPVEWLAGVAVATILAAMLVVNGPHTGELLDGSGVLPAGADTLLRMSNDLQQVLPWLALSTLVVRFAASSALVRRQLVWFVLAAASIALDALELVRGIPVWLDGVRLVPWIPLAIAVAVVRHGAFDTPVRRSVVYGFVVGGVLAAYAASLGALALLLDLRGPGARIVAAGIVALAVLPVAPHARRVADRLIYGVRRDPSSAVASIGAMLTDSGLRDDPSALERAVAAAAGTDVALLGAEATVTGPHFPLVHGGRLVGFLVATPRPPEPHLTRSSIRVLESLVPIVAAAVHAEAMYTELTAARTRLVTAREEERRRLRRDLHDGLGPALAGITMEIQAARAIVHDDPGRCDAMLAAAEGWSRAAIDDIRRVVYALRPPALDQYGLVGALEQQAAKLGLHATVRLEGVRALPPLPAAAEVAAYLVAAESLTNIARHAGTDRCHLTMSATPSHLTIDITDDGIGLPAEVRQGVGLSSMHERAVELGGSCRLTSSREGGTTVALRLPIGSPT